MEIPSESLDDLQQVDGRPEIPIAPVPVRVDGPVNTHELPARLGTVTDFALTSNWQLVLGGDLKRKRLTLVAPADWLISHGPVGGARWPANVPLIVTHASPVYGRSAGADQLLTVIPEEWAD